VRREILARFFGIGWRGGGMSRVPVGSALVLGVSDLVVVGAWLDFLIGDFFLVGCFHYYETLSV